MRSLLTHSTLVALTFIALVSRAEVSAPPLTRPVIDETGTIDAREIEQLERMLNAMHESGAAQMAIYVTNSLQETDIDDFAVRVFEQWKLGDQGKDQGLLLVVAPKERQMRIEVGDGLEGTITDAFARHVHQDVISPYFRNQRYGEGLLVGTEAIARKLGLDLKAPVERRLAPRGRNLPWLPLIFVGIWLFLFLRAVLFPGGAGRRWGHRRGTRGIDTWSHWGGFGGGGSFGGSSGGGGFSGGGGRSSGGGFSGSW